MKQHITADQLNELSPKAKEKLREWWKPDISDLLYRPDNPEGLQEIMGFIGEAPIKKECYPLLSIGQMIEFLDENGRLWIEQEEEIDEDIPKKYRVQSRQHEYWSTELCDALWQACEEILEKEV